MRAQLESTETRMVRINGRVWDFTRRVTHYRGDDFVRVSAQVWAKHHGWITTHEWEGYKSSGRL